MQISSIEQHQAKACKGPQCPDCHKKMQPSSIAKHQAKSCKAVVPTVEVPAVEVPPIVEQCEMIALLLYNGYAKLTDE